MANSGAPESQVEITLKDPGKVLHFSDGIDENIEDENVAELEAPPTSEEVDAKSLSWGPWFSHQTWKTGSKVLYAMDYAGESLANFFGITSPKYQLEIDEYERIKEEKRQMDEESATWVGKYAGGDIPLVLNEPTKSADKPAEV